MYLALIEPGTYLDFINSVPFSGADGTVGLGVLNNQGKISGRAQSAVRPISASDFNRIVSIGLAENEPELPRVDDVEQQQPPGELSDLVQAPFEYEQDCGRVMHLSSRAVRSRLFRRLVPNACDK